MSEQGPYTVQFNEAAGAWRVEGPTPHKWNYANATDPQEQADQLNAAFAAGRLSASEQGEELIQAGDEMAALMKKYKYVLGFDMSVREWDRAKAKTAGEQPSQSSPSPLGDAAQSSGPGQTGVPSSEDLGPAGAAVPPPIADAQFGCRRVDGNIVFTMREVNLISAVAIVHAGYVVTDKDRFLNAFVSRFCDMAYPGDEEPAINRFIDSIIEDCSNSDDGIQPVDNHSGT